MIYQTDFCIPLKAPTSPFTAAAMYKPAECIAMPPPEKLAAFRDLVVGGRCGKVRVSEETSEVFSSPYLPTYWLLHLPPVHPTGLCT